MTRSVKSRREYLNTMRKRYQQTTSRTEKTKIINEVVKVLNYRRKHATTVLNQPPSAPKPPVKRGRPFKYLEAMPVLQSVWEALDYPCAGEEVLVIGNPLQFARIANKGLLVDHYKNPGQHLPFPGGGSGNLSRKQRQPASKRTRRDGGNFLPPCAAGFLPK